MVSDNETLDKVYTAQTSEELMDAYKNWASDYDADTVEQFGYVAHIASAQALNNVMEKKDGRILDAGCGTGLVGQELRQMGYTRLDALDYSKEMLDEAQNKNIYQNHIQADLSVPLKIKDDTYEAVVCTGTFTYGHVKANAFDELVRITQPNGIICFTIREGAYEDYGYREKMIDLEKSGRWELIEMQDTDYLKKEAVTCKICTYRVAKQRAK
jgi:predicted TPR repeat methyltransferase